MTWFCSVVVCTFRRHPLCCRQYSSSLMTVFMKEFRRPYTAYAGTSTCHMLDSWSRITCALVRLVSASKQSTCTPVAFFYRCWYRALFGLMCHSILLKASHNGGPFLQIRPLRRLGSSIYSRDCGDSFLQGDCHGVPASLVSDRDPVFTSAFWKALFTAMGSELHMSSTFHPQLDGQSEAVNKVIAMYLRCMVGDRPRN